MAGPHTYIHTYTAHASTAVLPYLDTVEDSAYHRLSVSGLIFLNNPALPEKSAEPSPVLYTQSRITIHT